MLADQPYRPSDSEFNEACLLMLFSAVDEVDEDTFHRIVCGALYLSGGKLDRAVIFHAVKLCERRGWDIAQHITWKPHLSIVRDPKE